MGFLLFAGCLMMMISAFECACSIEQNDHIEMYLDVVNNDNLDDGSGHEADGGNKRQMKCVCEFEETPTTGEEELSGSNLCKNGGTLSETEEGFACVCQEGYSGKRCQDKLEGCQPVWNTLNSTSSAGGLLKAVTSLADCLSTCLADSTCVGVDLDYNTNQCFHHINTIQGTFPAYGIDQHRITRCGGATNQAVMTTPGCYPVWDTLWYTSSSGGQSKRVNSIAECLSTCVADSTCVGADIGFNTTQCYHHTKIQSTLPSHTMHQHRLVTRCGTTTTQAATTRPATSQPGSTTP